VDDQSPEDSDYTSTWIQWFLSTRGNEYFCQIDEEFIQDRFNLTNLNLDVQHFNQAIEMMIDQLGEESRSIRPSFYVNLRETRSRLSIVFLELKLFQRGRRSIW
jgi:hypothetical protein